MKKKEKAVHSEYSDLKQRDMLKTAPDFNIYLLSHPLLSLAYS